MATNKKSNIFERKLKEQKRKSKPKEKIDFDKLVFRKISNSNETYDFDTNPEFRGKYLRSEKRKGKKNKEGKAEDYVVNIFLNEHGDEVALPNNHNIKEAIAEHGETYYKFTFLKKKKIAGGHSVRTFDVEVV